MNRVSSASFRLELGRPKAAVKTLGTGGLSATNDNPGSYSWLAVADPESRNGVVAGWLTEERASGVLFPSIVDDTGFSRYIETGYSVWITN